MLSKLSFLLTALLAVFVCLGGDLTGVVTKVSDGDTIFVGREKIRLQRIDAPESSQPFGGEATAFLKQLVLGQSVRVQDQGRDRYGRMLGIVYLNDVDVNLMMVREGYAWHYTQYDHTAAYAQAEAEARAAKKGLWAAAKPQRPSEYRHGGVQKIRNTNPYHPITDAEPDTGYWLNTNSNKRHNRKCPNYRKTRGRPCGPSEGQAAGCCGG